MHKVKVIKREFIYIDNMTCEPANPTFNERMLDAMNGGGRYGFVQLYTDCGEVRGRTHVEIHEKVWEKVQKEQLGDVELFYMK